MGLGKAVLTVYGHELQDHYFPTEIAESEVLPTVRIG
jgi:hypothetical protein